jgi:hypothetical protein
MKRLLIVVLAAGVLVSGVSVATTNIVSLDGDAEPAVAELTTGTDPLDGDTDGDGLGDSRERAAATDPTVSDTDGDGLDDGPEVDEYGTDPTAADTDGDGLDDPTEVDGPTDPTAADTDGDGLDDGREFDLGTEPTVADTDGDGLDDGAEIDGETAGGVALPGSDPLSMDLYVQISYAASATRKSTSFLADLRSQWSKMPIENPDGTTGIDLHVEAARPRSETVTFTGSDGSFGRIESEHYADNVGDRAGVYHNVMFVEFDDGDQYDGYGEVPGKFAIVEANVDSRVQRNMMVHELLHGVVGPVDAGTACPDDPIHICTNGWLQIPVRSEDEFLSEAVAEEIETNGFEG